MRVRFSSLASTAMAVTVLSGSTLRAGGEQADLVVRVYDQRRGVRGGSAKALTVAAEILAAATIKVHWRVCIDPGPDPGCNALPASGERSVRLMEADDRQNIAGAALGRVADPGIWRDAHVFVNRVVRQSGRAGCDLQLLLGRAIAHELGHLLLERESHSPDGLMRASWSDDSLRISQEKDWQFNARQAAAMRARLGLR
jgi:hypothetical protein